MPSCTTGNFNCTKTFTFGRGLNVTGGSGSVSVSLNLAVDSSSSGYMTITDVATEGSCAQKITFCTANYEPHEVNTNTVSPVSLEFSAIDPTPITVLTDVTCGTDDDGNPTITKTTATYNVIQTTVYSGPSATTYYTLEDDSDIYTLESDDSIWGFGSGSSVKVVGAC